MTDQEWVKTLEDGRKVKFIYQQFPEDGAFITAQIAGNEVVYSVVLTKAKKPLLRKMLKVILRASFQRGSTTHLSTDALSRVFGTHQHMLVRRFSNPLVRGLAVNVVHSHVCLNSSIHQISR